MQIACHEACSNCDRARLPFGPGSVTVEADARRRGRASLRGAGQRRLGRAPRRPVPYRGHGLPLMEALDGVRGGRARRRTAATPGPPATVSACMPSYLGACSSTHSNGSGIPASASRVGRAFVYIDPYRVPDGAPPADLILVTHGHYDHFSPQDVERLSTREHLARGPGGGGRAGERPGALDRAGRGARGRARARRARARDRGLQHLQARRRRQALPPARRRLGGLRAERARRAALPLGRHRRDPRDGQRDRASTWRCCR